MSSSLATAKVLAADGSSSQQQSLKSKITTLTSPLKHHLVRFHEGTPDDIALLGSKGARLCELVHLKLPVPPGFIVGTKTCSDFLLKEDKRTKIAEILLGQCRRAVKEVEKQSDKLFGFTGKSTDEKYQRDNENKLPLLLSIRSSAPVSLPGAVNSVLNLGMNDEVAAQMARVSGNARWAYDTYRRFLESYGSTVLFVKPQQYEEARQSVCAERGVEGDGALGVDELQAVVAAYQEIVTVPFDPWTQLVAAIEALFVAWAAPTARKLRDLHNLPEDMLTAVAVQEMVYGNFNDKSGAGVALSRNPVTGDRGQFGEFLPCTEGVEIVRGTRTPGSLQDMRETHHHVISYGALQHILSTLEAHYKDMQAVEFTIENGKLFILHCRTAKRTARAAVRVAVSLVGERVLTEREALLRIDPQQMSFFLHPVIDPAYANPLDEDVKARIVGHGLGSSAGLAVGKLVFDRPSAVRCQDDGEPYILCMRDSGLQDIPGLEGAAGVLAINGGQTSHAAVHLRSINKPAVTGVSDLTLDLGERELRTADGSRVLRAGDSVSLDGSSGLLYEGAMPSVPAGQDAYFMTVLQWADRYKSLEVRASVQSSDDLFNALELGADGIGQLKTKHMFTKHECLTPFRLAILSPNAGYRAKYLDELEALHTRRFASIFQQLDGRVVKIRLLDVSLGQFLPQPLSESYADDVRGLSEPLGVSSSLCRENITALQDSDPEIGLRGARSAVLWPELAAMQIKAIVGGILDAKKRGLTVRAGVIIPQTFSHNEVRYLIPLLDAAVRGMGAEVQHSARFLSFEVGAMLEVPRACLMGDRVAETPGLDFVCLSTNNLTQLLFGMSRADMQKHMPTYIEARVAPKDPFCELDVPALGPMLQLAVQKCKEAKKDLAVDVYGEHCSHTKSVRFLSTIGANSICCEPHRVPTAKVAAAQAKIRADSE